MDVQKGEEEFHQAEKDIRDMMNSGDEGESQFAQGFDLTSFLESTGI